MTLDVKMKAGTTEVESDVPPRSSQAKAPVKGALGTAYERLEDDALLRGQGRYADDVPEPRGMLHAHVFRSTEAHARILSVDVDDALGARGVASVITGEDIRKLSDPFLVALKQPIDQWSLAVDKVRYVGEPVAVVIADSRYLAEDAADLIKVRYERLEVVVRASAAIAEGAPVLHEAAGSNEISCREFRYGEPQAAFENAEHVISTTVDYPRSSYTPMECFVVVADYHGEMAGYDVLANFQGPFSVHPVMARSLRVPGSRLRLRTPADSGGSFGIKLSVFPYIVLMSLAARIVGRPVKWVEDRLEHLMSANSCPNRTTTIDAAVDADGRVQALRMDNMEDYGAYLRAPMPGPLYRMQGAMTGAYDVPNLELIQRVVLSNKMPAALVRGFGGPQLYLALERLMQRIAVELDLDPLDVIRCNLIQPDAFPYRTCSGGLYDSGNYQETIELALGDGKLQDLQRRRDAARAEGRHYGIGFATVVEPGMSNMGYLSTLVSPEKREKAGPKNGAISMVSVNVDPLGSVSVTADVTVQGQGHQTALAQIVGDRLGLDPATIHVNLEIDTQKDKWSIAAGSYSCRFTPGTAVAAHIAADKIRARVARLAASSLNVKPEQLEFADGMIFDRANPDNHVVFHRTAGIAHWSPILVPAQDEPGLSEVGIWAPPQLEPPNSSDQINTSLTYGFVFDMCGVEIDPVTQEVRVDRYVSAHDAGKLLNPLIADGQIRGAFVQGLASALYEEFVYDDTGALLTGTFADYLVPTAMEVPEIEILHTESPSPFTPLGAKGLAEGNCMSTPVCIANAVADALGIESVPLPITPDRLNALVGGEEPTPPEGLNAPAPEATGGEKALTGSGSFTVPGAPEDVWASLLDPDALKDVIPGCHSVAAVSDTHFVAEVSLGVGPVKGRFSADVALSNLKPNEFAHLAGALTGPLGDADGTGNVRLSAVPEGCQVDYDYRVNVNGKVAAVGGRMLGRATDIVIGKFFERLAGHVAGGDAVATGEKSGLRKTLAKWFGGPS